MEDSELKKMKHKNTPKFCSHCGKPMEEGEPEDEGVIKGDGEELDEDDKNIKLSAARLSLKKALGE